MRRLLPLLAALLPLSAAAAPATVAPCDERASVENLVEPWADHSATYAEGAIRIALIDTSEPAAAPVHLAIIAPPLNELGLRRCSLVSLAPGSGFYDLDFAARRADYDPGRGLTLTFPAETFDPDTGGGKPATLTVTINQSSGQIATNIAP